MVLQATPALKVTLTTVQRQSLQPHEKLTGRLYPLRSSALHFEVAGRLAERLVEPGAAVSRGKPLLRLDRADYEDQLKQAQSEFNIEKQGAERDRVLLQLAQDNLQLQENKQRRLEHLSSKNMVAKNQLDDAHQQVIALRGEVQKLEFATTTANSRIAMQQSKLSQAQRNLARTTLRAPFDGYVNEVLLEQGDRVSLNALALTVVDTSAYDLQLQLRGELLGGLFLGQEITVSVADNNYVAKVIALQPDPDLDTNTHELRIRLQGQGLRSGMLAIANLPHLPLDQVLTIPSASVMSMRGESYVFVYDNGAVNRKLVQLGKRVGQEVLVLEGLQVGQTVVARDIVSLRDGQAVVFE
jgi:RND family efflux transporter MFP subunit